MKVKYELTDREKEFLVALHNKPNKNKYSGRSEDDRFISAWKKEIESTRSLFRKSDSETPAENATPAAENAEKQ